MNTVTAQTYNNLDEAYAFFNKRFFGGTLPSVAITLTRSKKFYGFFQPNSFRQRNNAKPIGEIALNPDAFLTRNNEDVLSTLLHEMVHVWQENFGKTSRSSYHNKQFATKMAEVGLICSSTGQAGGKTTGQKMSHYINPDGEFAHMLKAGYFSKSVVDYGSSQFTAEPKPRKVSKVKYTCPNCNQNAWAKPNTKLICGNCYEYGEWNNDPIQHMQAQGLNKE